MCPCRFPSTVRCLSTRRRWQPESLAEGALCVVCLFILCPSRCESTAEDDTTASSKSSTNNLSTNHDRHPHHPRSHLKTSALMNSNSNPLTSQHQQLLAQLIRMKHLKKSQLLSNSSPLSHLLQSPFQTSSTRAVPNDVNDSFEQKVKRFKASHRKTNQVSCLTLVISFHRLCLCRRTNSLSCYHLPPLPQHRRFTMQLCQRHPHRHNRSLNVYHKAILLTHRRHNKPVDVVRRICRLEHRNQAKVIAISSPVTFCHWQIARRAVQCCSKLNFSKSQENCNRKRYGRLARTINLTLSLRRNLKITLTIELFCKMVHPSCRILTKLSLID